jgi:DNA-binding NtrC family response regulator
MATPVKVLVVDDEEIVLKSMRRILKKDEEHDFQVDTALSAPEGLALMNDNTYDVIVTDLMMPQMDGLEFIDRVRATDPNSLIIMITGYATMQTALEALRKGAYDYIAKPFTVEELRSVVKNAARASLMPEAENGKPNGSGAGKKAGAYRSFFNQTYASARPDGTFNFGIETAFISLIGKPISLELASAGVTEGLVRISVGIEDWRDLLHDFETALDLIR